VLILLGTFAKILAPGVRLGWIQTKNQDRLKALSSSGVLLSGGNFNLTSGIVSRSLFESYALRSSVNLSVKLNDSFSSIEKGLLQKQLEVYLRQYEERTQLGVQLCRSRMKNFLDITEPKGTLRTLSLSMKIHKVQVADFILDFPQ
jgi:DNA-binding transcriptional MocR family regulator